MRILRCSHFGLFHHFSFTVMPEHMRMPWISGEIIFYFALSLCVCVCLLVVVFLFILFFHLQPQILWQPLIMNKQSSSLSLLAQLRSSNKLPDLTSFEFALLLRFNLFSYFIPSWNIYQRVIAFLFKFYANCGRKYFWPFYFVLLSCCASPFSRSLALTR